MTRLQIILGLFPSAILLGGCGNSRPDPTFQPVKPEAATGAPVAAPPAKAFATPARPAAVADDDPLATPDQLATGAGGGAGTSDPVPHPADDDQIAAGPRMPTEHSHWLHGAIFNAHVAVSLNGIPLGEFRAPVDKDITMKLRRGVNTITFAYKPQMATSSARLEVLESEHASPIPPLATFQSPRFEIGKPPQAITITRSFVAN